LITVLRNEGFSAV